MQTRILIFEDKALAYGQKKFLNDVLTKVNELFSEFHKIGIENRFDVGDLDSLPKMTPKDFIKRKTASLANGVEINGIPLKSDKVLEMMEIKSDTFEEKFLEVKLFINNAITGSDVYYGTSRTKNVSFNSKFFKLDESFKIDDTYFEEWKKTNCEVYTKNEQEKIIYSELKKVVESFNNLQSIGNSESHEIAQLKTNPKSILDSPLGSLLQVNYDGQFEINPKLFGVARIT